MSSPEIEAVALVRIPEWEPPEDADVRELDDGSALVFLEVPYDAEDDAILNALDDVLGDALLEQDDERGVFVLPDASEPEDAESYDAVLAAVGEEGRWIALDPEMPEDVQRLMQNPQELLGQMFEAMGVGNADDILRAMQTGDPDALKLAQIQMTSAMERAMTPPESKPPEEPSKKPPREDE
jgi:hypothetical protein